MIDVLIVGRPNVGKSTLFNRIVRKRKSIVHNMPGVTRDVVQAIAEWKGKKFTVGDTGGVLDTQDQMAKAIETHVKRYLQDAKVIIFVVDGREGITASDLYIANLLYPYKGKVFVAVNKIDNKSLEKTVYEFYSLGFDRVIPISAQHGKGIGELLDIIEPLIESTQRQELEGIRMCFLGRPNVGKSSLVNAILNDEKVIVSPVAGTTRDAIEIPFEYNDQSFILVDTAGIRRKSRVEYGVEFFSVNRSLEALEMSDIACLVLDMSEGITHQDKTIGSLIARRYKGCIIVANKMDFVKVSFKEVESYIKKELNFLDYAPVVYTIAPQRKGILDILKQALKVYKDYTTQHKTSFINRVLQKIVSESPPPKHQSKEVKVYYSIQESTKPPTLVIFTNFAEGWKESYKRFLTKKLREALNIKHAPIKLVIKGREREKV